MLRELTSSPQVYNVAGGRSLPEWLSEKKREALRKDEEFRRRIELIQARRASAVAARRRCERRGPCQPQCFCCRGSLARCLARRFAGLDSWRATAAVCGG